MQYTQYISNYDSPIGSITIASTDTLLTGLWFNGQKYFANTLKQQKGFIKQKETSIINLTKQWLDIYFSSQKPSFTPQIKMLCSEFRKLVWNELLTIPFGKTKTYGEIASIISKKKGVARMSAQAVGSAISHNSISLIIPCHRVISSKGDLTGYAGGLDKKAWLLNHERISY